MDLERSRAEMPDSTSAILDRRDLSTGNPGLAQLLRPGVSVLDVGCGSGAITRGIAERVGRSGEVIGADANERFIQRAEVAHPLPGLSFVVADVYALPYEHRFDVVTAARLLQWLARPLEAIQSLAKALRPGGWLVILDYNHERIQWEPEPAASALAFYEAFLRWRSEAGFDNAIADRLASLLKLAGLNDVGIAEAHEVSLRGEPGLALWAEVAASRGHQMVRDGAVGEQLRASAEAEYRRWAQVSGERQVLYLLSCQGRTSETR